MSKKRLPKLYDHCRNIKSIADLFHLMKGIPSTMCFAFSRKMKSLSKLIAEESEKIKTYQDNSDPNYEASQKKIARLTKEKALIAIKHSCCDTDFYRYNLATDIISNRDLTY